MNMTLFSFPLGQIQDPAKRLDILKRVTMMTGNIRRMADGIPWSHDVGSVRCQMVQDTYEPGLVISFSNPKTAELSVPDIRTSRTAQEFRKMGLPIEKFDIPAHAIQQDPECDGWCLIDRQQATNWSIINQPPAQPVDPSEARKPGKD